MTAKIDLLNNMMQRVALASNVPSNKQFQLLVDTVESKADVETSCTRQELREFSHACQTREDTQASLLDERLKLLTHELKEEIKSKADADVAASLSDLEVLRTTLAQKADACQLQE